MVFAIDPVLPDAWVEVSLAAETPGLQHHWADACKGIIRNLEERGLEKTSLALEEVQRHVLIACGLCPDGDIRSPHWIESLPEAEWAVSTAWGESSRSPFGPGSLWAASQGIRAVDDELNALCRLREYGVHITTRSRQPQGPDWEVTTRNGPGHLEVKSKGAEGLALDFLYAAIQGALLADRIGGLRKLDWHVGPSSNDAGICSWCKSDGRLDALVRALFEIAEPLSQWLYAGRPENEERHWEVTEEAVAVSTLCSGKIFLLQFVDERTGGEFTYEGVDRREGSGPWVFTPGRASGGALIDRVSEEQIQKSVEVLDRSLLRTGTRRGRQLLNFPEGTIFLICWHAPFFWSEALAKHPEDVQRIIDLVSDRANEVRPGTSVAVWVRSFKVSRVVANASCRAVLGI